MGSSGQWGPDRRGQSGPLVHTYKEVWGLSTSDLRPLSDGRGVSAALYCNEGQLSRQAVHTHGLAQCGAAHNGGGRETERERWASRRRRGRSRTAVHGEGSERLIRCTGKGLDSLGLDKVVRAVHGGDVVHKLLHARNDAGQHDTASGEQSR